MPNVDIRAGAFVPGNLRVQHGNSVTWTSRDDTNHTVTVDGGAELAFLRPSQLHTEAFTDPPGTVLRYHCRLHPAMTGRIEIYL